MATRRSNANGEASPTDDDHDANRPATSEDGRDHEGISLPSAFRRLREAVRASLPLHPGDDIRSFEWRELRRLCEAHDQVVEHDPSLWLGTPSGSEHNCRSIDGLQRYLKVTKRNRAGWRIDFGEMQLCPATPLQYLRRLLLVNFYFSDEIEFVGLEVGPSAGDTRIATTQPSLVSNAGALSHPTIPQLRRQLEGYGFRHLDPASLPHTLGESESMHFRRGDLWLFDVRPHNFVVDGERCIPIDVIVQRQGPDDIDDSFYDSTVS